MSITRIDLFPISIPLKAPFVTSLGAIHAAENVFVRITTDDGFVGWGECNPFWSINGETQETCMVVGRHIAKALIGHHALDIEEAQALMDRMIFGNRSIKSAFDIALWDIYSESACVPFEFCIGAKQLHGVFTDYTVSLGDPQRMAADAEAIMRNGFQAIKVKLGGEAELDYQRIWAIRERVPQSIPLRIDANQGWDPETAIRVLNSLAPFNIQHCEEPIPRWQFMELRRVKEASPIPIMADESCCDRHDAARLIDLGACQRFNIKLGKCGGITEACKIIELAESAGLEVQIGGFMESRLAWTAAYYLAGLSPCVKYFDMDTPLMFTADPVVGGINYGEGGAITAPSYAIGLCASVAPEYLKGGIKIS